MTTARELVRAATAVGAKLAIIGDKLSITAPRPLTPELVEELRRAKVEILRLIAVEPGDDYRFPDDAARWRRDFAIRTIHWAIGSKRTKVEAERLAYGELLKEWHERYGALPDPRRCAGCGNKLPNNVGLILCDGARIHFDGMDGADCIIAYGRRWRGAAFAALCALGLERPAGFELL
jgi:hypothetical protein